MRPRRIGEFELIQQIRNTTRLPQAVRSAVLTGIGDDAAVLKTRPGRVLLATSDLLAESVHFDLAYTTYRQLGYKAAMVNFSDIAAMGGTPRFVLVALALTARQTPSHVTAFYAGIAAACRGAGAAAIVGGDTSASRTGLFLSLTVLGDAPPNTVLRRSTARVGDHLYVTGTLGDAQAGLEILQRRKKQSRPAKHGTDVIYLTTRHLMPTARIAEGQLLADRRLASAAMDLSDGLAGDIRHLCKESKVGCLLETQKLPLSRPLLAYAKATKRDPVAYALSGGEDYELLFTAPPANITSLESLIHRRVLRATHIGHITPASRGLRLIGADGTIQPLIATGYEHRLR